MFSFTETELIALVAAFVWPFVRISAMLLAAPIFGAGTVPVRIRIVLALVLALMVAPLLPEPPSVSPFSLEGLVVTAQQVLIGVTMGFIMQMVLSALTMAGESIALSMGLGYASMVDPAMGVQVPVVSQFFVIMGTLIFLAMNGHLVMLEMIVRSFELMPVAVDGLNRVDMWTVVQFGSTMYVGALLVGLPIVSAMLMVNLSMGVITRASPQLNIFAVGFPMMILLGFILIMFTLPALIPRIEDLAMAAFTVITRMLGS
ncbi:MULTISPECIES: flagellar biosynthetic protein FliR [Ectothiorhodospira]|uniref:Flagellar biosynthetic protein FliR n=1 Tax=Ectothiorhodospira marina TaxID=1396821 RepID=A0A1H7MUF3_9GAMM|nr:MULTISPECIES: flagellar biosynthetic protein FliR [Ectothiorhodospira]MCG5514998.1 flagellar biosynthetic protein FliR [Ectothiorhodospira sp. 9100]MCG5517678.1 flagellar biosynthetic protein FliR [Ectothiorhodospira sp. 9905]SEL14679.1 flagellar biosynthetic protein FliR [Ectothiorhodospira marina]